MTDTGRLSMEDYKGILYCEAYMNDEFTVTDLETLRAEIRNHYNGHTDMILYKSGTYSVAMETQRLLLRKVPEIGHFVYVVDNKVKRASAEFAAGSYMQSYHTQIAGSKEEAYELLQSIKDEH